MICKVRSKGIFASFVVASALVLHVPAPFAAAQSAGAAAASAASSSRPTLDYEFFKANVEPIFLKRRSADRARCYICHQESHHNPQTVSGGKASGPFHLEVLSPGNSFWTEEQSRLNFQTVSRLVVPGAPLSSLLLLNALATEAGGYGDKHEGGRQFLSRDDPDWQILAEWVRGKKESGSSGR